ncbi:MAG: hypothetical protein QMD85_02315 [Candidatus Aenigmarchaeota archaeon]|nr:hypothetical protein [Candidatus Aenigmarchaeota archaeon]MDI6722372.1 hypothetical protein [Candidatus Aenigmarchaeota archaeon]
MQEEKHISAIKEVDRTVEDALKGSILDHQRRLTSMISIGIQHLIELYFHRLHIIKPGAYVKHEWFRMSEKNTKLRLSSIITNDFDKIPQLAEILAIAREIEKDRNEILYGASLKDDAILRNKIDEFLEIKKIIEKETGEVT